MIVVAIVVVVVIVIVIVMVMVVREYLFVRVLGAGGGKKERNSLGCPLTMMCFHVMVREV